MTKPRKREYALMAAAFALALFYWSGGDRPEDHILDSAATQGYALTGPRLAEPAVAAPLCQSLYRGQWLYSAIKHSGDREKLRIECFYGHGGTRFVL